jgi:multidrug efflux pump
VDKARPYLPKDADEPVITEINTSDFPVAIVNVYGTAPERTLSRVADRLQDVIESISGILEAEIGGKREEQIEIVINPGKVDSYKLSLGSLASFLQSTNILIPAGNIEAAGGSFPIKVPGLIENVDDVMNLPVKTRGDGAVRLYDIADVRRNYKDAEGYVRMNGAPSLSLEIKKRVGANTIDTVDAVRYVLSRAAKVVPENVMVSVTNDTSLEIRDNLLDLENSVISAVLLVVLCVMLMLGIREGLLVGLSIPLSFLLGLVFLSLCISSINMIVLFGLILSVGMLVDGAIVITEYSDQELAKGASRVEAYGGASKRMALVVILSTVTTLMAFAPMVFWPGTMGEFMRFLPLTVICVLSASLVVALVFLPILGAVFGSKTSEDTPEKAQILAADMGEYDKLTGYMKFYHNILDWVLKRPGKIFGGVCALLVASIVSYGLFGVGIELFPASEPNFVNINVHARGNLSVDEKTRFVLEVERKAASLPYFKNIYARSGARSRDASEDVVGYVQVELKDWKERPGAEFVMARLGEVMSEVAGVELEVVKQREGPSSGKPIDIRISAIDDNPELIDSGYKYIMDAMDKIGGFVNVEDTTSLPGIQWEMKINKVQAAKLGVSVGNIGQVVQMLTHGAKVSSYMPSDLDEEIDIVVRYPRAYRALDQIGNLYVVGANGQSVPLSSFVKIEPSPKVNMIQRIDGKRTIRVRSDVASGEYPAAKVALLKQHIAQSPPADGVEFTWKGEDQDGKDNMGFLGYAFLMAVFMMFLLLLAQFNSFYSVFMILFSILLSTIGVLWGLMITRDPFSIVMTGLAVVSLAGIIINNNIILIDAYNEISQKVEDPIDALKRTGLQRLRPVYLTTITTILGVMPMALKLNIDFVNADISIGAPSMAMWAAFSRSIAFGLCFATLLTLIVTPCMILLGVRARAWIKARFAG